MARVAFFLYLVLTLSMGGSRSPAAISPGSPRTGFWWGTQESQQIGLRAARLRSAGNYAAAEALYEQQLALVEPTREDVATIRALLSLGAIRELRHHFRGALDPLLRARRLARSIGDRLDLGAAAFNLSSLYLEMWDLDSAVSLAEEAVAASASVEKPYYRHIALLYLGRLHQMLDDGRAEGYFQRAIEAARELGDAAQEARAWDLLGEEWLRRGQLTDSERALDEAFRIRLACCRGDVPFSYARLGALKLTQGDLDQAGRLTNLAIEAGTQVQSSFPDYLLRDQRGRIRLARGDVSGAIGDFRSAAEESTRWRREVLPASSVLTATNSELETRIFDSFIETAAHQAIRTGDARLARESFQALEWNRAAGLRETVGLAAVWREKLPPEYWDLLGELRQQQARELPTGRINLKLTEMEAEAGLRFGRNRQENFRTQTSLIYLRQGLRRSQLLLSFHFGGQESYVWALTRQSLHLYALAPAAQIRTDLKNFRQTIIQGRVEARPLGAKVYRELFGKLSREESAKPEWALSVDDALFETPLAALSVPGNGTYRYLAETHTLEIVPGALWLDGGSKAITHGRFLGVGDPIYNTADVRWQSSEPRKFTPWFAQAATTEGMLNRLVGSGHEVEQSASSWPERVVLTGADARRENFVALAASGVSIVHLATHVLTPRARSGEALIAFGLEPAGETGYLTTADVAMLHVPGAVVTMTGCASGGGDARAGAGLLGLTRAWQIAGAGAVVSTLWPVRDSNGDLFAAFYRHLHQATPEEALRRSQMEMIGSGTWRADPRYWAAYQVTGGKLAR